MGGMLKILYERMRQGYKTLPFPRKEPVLPERYRGLPLLDTSKCRRGCVECVNACPTGAVTVSGGGRISIDLGKCLFCNDCIKSCPEGSISFSRDYRLAVRKREELFFHGEVLELAAALEKKALRIFKRSLRLRQVSAGGCNGCEMDTNVLTTIVFDLSRFGIQFVASPRHADGLLITGPVSGNMLTALKKTYDAVPDPKIVIAAGACAISGGPYINHPEVKNGVDPVLPVDLYIPGCPPHPLTILDGLLRLLDRI